MLTLTLSEDALMGVLFLLAILASIIIIKDSK